MEVPEVLRATSAPEDVEPHAVQRRRVAVPRRRSSSRARALVPCELARVERMQVTEVLGLALPAEIHDTVAYKRRGVPIAGFGRRPSAPRLDPRVLVDVEDVRVVEIHKALTGSAVVVAPEKEDPSGYLLGVAGPHQCRRVAASSARPLAFHLRAGPLPGPLPDLVG